MHRIARPSSLYRALSTATALPSRAPASSAVADLFEDQVTNHMLSPRIPPPPTPPPPPTHMRDAILYTPSEKPAYDRQIQLELQTVAIAVDRYKKLANDATKRGDVITHKPASDLLYSWYNPLATSIRDAMESGCLSVNSDSKHRFPLKQETAQLLDTLSVDAVTVITLHTILGSLLREANGVPLARLAINVANALRAEINMKRINSLQRMQQLAEQRSASNVKEESTVKRKRRPRKPHNVLNNALKHSSSLVSAVNYAAQQISIQGSTWCVTELVSLGTKLIDLMIKASKVEDRDGNIVPAIQHFKRFRKTDMTTVGMLQLTDSAIRILSDNDMDFSGAINPKQQPMLIRPRPWTSPTDGAYLRCTVPLVRTAPSGQRDLQDALAGADLSTLFDGLNALGDQAWRVNEDVYEVADELWSRGGGTAGLVTKSNAKVPSKADFMEEQIKAFERRKEEMMAWRAQEESDGEEEEPVFDEKKATRKLRMERRKAQKLNRELVSMRADTYHRLDQAARFLKEERFWLPHNVDFRGRAYPIPVHLQHMGCDLTRALLTFSGPGVELGERGVYWLKIHLANLLGADKLSFDERIEVAEAAMTRAIEVGRDPLSERNVEWWSNAEDPFQLLAACVEVANATGRHGGSRAMERFESTLPISMDGSCNGLQHYAALGRDVEGGTQVNLVPNSRPQDVYSGIADLVRQKIRAMADEGDEVAQLLRDKVSRKVVKQTVMTSVYGVTLIGARQQIQNRLAEMKEVPEDKLFVASMKLASLTLSSLGDIFSGATGTMDWLAECAARIAKSGREVQWTTPIGLPAIQPYRRNERVVVQTLMQRVKIEGNGGRAPVSSLRQRSAFPPNFVHSIDSAHMLLTAVACRKRGLNFAAVHDSFWTNAASVDAMNAILREEFIRLHERDLLSELREGFLMRYEGVRVDDVPRRGQLQLSLVRHSPYFFS